MYPSITLSRSTSPNPTLTNENSCRRRLISSVADMWCTPVDTTLSTFQMNAYFLMSGFMNAISFSAVFVWCGFQSGNTAQLAIAIARLWEGETTQFLLADKQALTSLSSFLIGSLLVRLGERMGPTTRGWLWLATICQALLTMAAAIASWRSGQGYPGISDDRYEAGPAWDDALSFLVLSFMSMSMGMQGLMSMRLKTHSGATLPLTTTWCELVGIDGLFSLNKFNAARDQRMIGIASVLLGALGARGLTFRLGSPGALGIGAGIRVIIAFSWILVPNEAAREESDEKSEDGREVEEV